MIKPLKYILLLIIPCLLLASVQAISLPSSHSEDDKLDSEHHQPQQETATHTEDFAHSNKLSNNHEPPNQSQNKEKAEQNAKLDPQDLRNAITASPYHQTKAADLIEKRQGLTHKEPWEIIMRQAELAARSKDFDMAEGLYGHAFLLNPPEEAHKQGYLELANMYEQDDKKAKMAAVYEKFVVKFKDDPRLAQIYMRLGHLYREMGAYKMAISRFYNVLNETLKIDADGIDAYREISLQAQRDIADTYFTMGNFVEAEKFYKRLLLLDLNHVDQRNVMYKTNYLNFLQEDYSAAAAGLEEFLKLFPHSQFAPESHYMLANSFNALNQPMEAVRQVLKLLKTEHHITPEDMELWQYWRKKTANQLAEQFYEKGNFLSAIKIYQAMAPVNRNPSWQWPVIYQIGLCFERLHMYPKAQEAYRLLATSDEWDDIKFTMTPTLQSLQEMAAWRLEHLEWNTATKTRINNILEIAGQHTQASVVLDEETEEAAPTVHN